MCGSSRLSVRSSKGTRSGESQGFPYARENLPEGLSVGSLGASSFAQGYIPRVYAARNLRTIRSCDVAFQRGLVLGISGLSVRTRAPLWETYCGGPQDHPLARRFRQEGHAAVRLGTIRSRRGTYQRDIVRGVSALSACAWVPSKGMFSRESQSHPFARGQLPKKRTEGSLCAIRSREATFQRDIARGVLGLSVRTMALKI